MVSVLLPINKSVCYWLQFYVRYFDLWVESQFFHLSQFILPIRLNNKMHCTSCIIPRKLPGITFTWHHFYIRNIGFLLFMHPQWYYPRLSSVSSALTFIISQSPFTQRSRGNVIDLWNIPFNNDFDWLQMFITIRLIFHLLWNRVEL